MRFLLLLIHYYSYSKSISITNPTAEKLSKCLENVECPDTEATVCLSVRHKNQEPEYVIPLNKCEMEYLKCYPDVTAKIEPMEVCQSELEPNITTKSPTNVDAVPNRAKRSFKYGTPRTLLKSKKKTKSLTKGTPGTLLKSKKKTINLLKSTPPTPPGLESKKKTKKRQKMGVIQFSTTKQKTEDLKNLKEWSPKSLEQVEGRIYVGFVVELSRYMEDRLHKVKSCIQSVLDMIQDDGSKRIKDLVLSVYVYPERDGNLMTRTDDPSEFMVAVQDLTCMCQNCNCQNNTCEQNIYQATIQALDRAADHTNMFVFGNGPPSEEDGQYQSELIRLAKEKNVEVNFVLTGDCDAYEEQPFQSFYEVAAKVSGMVLRVDVNHLKREVVNYVNYTVLDFKRRVTLSKVYQASGYKNRRITFDVTDNDVFVSVAVSGNKVDCILRNRRYNNTLDYIYNVDTPHVKMYRYAGLPAGAYSLQMLPDVSFGEESFEDIAHPTLVTVAVSDIELMFKYGFDETRKSSWRDTSPQPRVNTPVYVMVAVREPKQYLEIKSVSFHKSNGEQISTYTLHETDSEDVYATKYPVVVPTEKKLKIMLTATLPYSKKEINKFSNRLVIPSYKRGGTTPKHLLHKTTSTSTTTESSEASFETEYPTPHNSLNG